MSLTSPASGPTAPSDPLAAAAASAASPLRDASPPMPKITTLEGFGPRLATIRQSRGMTQTEMGTAAGVSQRVVAYYEAESAQPPGSLLVDFARALKVSTDALLGVQPVREQLSPKTARLLKRLRRIEELPPADQRAVLKLVDAMLDTRRRTAPPAARAKRKAS